MRRGSPRSGCSILMTSAPKSANTRPANGPAISVPSSRTLRSLSGPITSLSRNVGHRSSIWTGVRVVKGEVDVDAADGEERQRLGSVTLRELCPMVRLRIFDISSVDEVLRTISVAGSIPAPPASVHQALVLYWFGCRVSCIAGTFFRRAPGSGANGVLAEKVSTRKPGPQKKSPSGEAAAAAGPVQRPQHCPAINRPGEGYARRAMSARACSAQLDVVGPGPGSARGARAPASGRPGVRGRREVVVRVGELRGRTAARAGTPRPRAPGRRLRGPGSQG